MRYEEWDVKYGLLLSVELRWRPTDHWRLFGFYLAMDLLSGIAVAYRR